MDKNNSDVYKTYRDGIENATNMINQRIGAKTKRRGIKGLRDRISFFKFSLTVAYTYIATIQTVIILLGITPQAIENINIFMGTLGIGFRFPVDLSSIIAVSVVIGLFVFGVLAILFFGLYKREQEIGVMQSPGFLLVAHQNYEIIKLLKEIKGGKK